jgi:dipeptide transport system substrate-binding protein
MDFASILSAEYADAMLKAGTPEQVDQTPIGTGPFTLVQYEKDATIRYKAFPEYWGGKAAIDDLVFAITPDASTRYAKLKAGECHVMLIPNPADLEAMGKDADLTLMNQPGLNIGYLAFNVLKKPFDDKRVRQALNMAIDKKSIIDAVYLGAGVGAINPMPPTIWGYNNNVKDYEYNPEKAKALLAEAGYADGFESDLWAMPVQRPYNPNAQRIGELIQADLAKLNIKTTIVSFEWGEYRKRAQAGEHMMAQLGWTGDNGDPDNFLFLLGCDGAREGGQNIAKWCNQEFDDLLKQARQLSDVGERTKIYEKMQEIFKEEAPWFTIAHSVVYEPVRKEVVGWKISPFGRHEFYGVDLAQ